MSMPWAERFLLRPGRLSDGGFLDHPELPTVAWRELAEGGARCAQLLAARPLAGLPAEFLEPVAGPGDGHRGFRGALVVPVDNHEIAVPKSPSTN
ncbi:MAG: hypothetical protein ACYDC1_13215 [Limisphaerales bacterium]